MMKRVHALILVQGIYSLVEADIHESTHISLTRNFLIVREMPGFVPAGEVSFVRAQDRLFVSAKGPKTIDAQAGFIECGVTLALGGRTTSRSLI